MLLIAGTAINSHAVRAPDLRTGPQGAFANSTIDMKFITPQ
jgi:hypothetical protein